MSRVVSSLIFVAIIVLLSMGCTRHLYNIHDAPIIPPAGQTFSLEEVTAKIMSSAEHTHPEWDLKKIRPGLIRGVLNFKQHQAVVDISYTTESFSIVYRDSKRLRYQSAEDTRGATMIQRHYNKWVSDLMEKRSDYWPKWESKPDKPILRATDGT